MSKANETQVGGSHYASAIQHWDYVWANKLNYFQAQITKYVTRYQKKNGIEDLLKAQHFLLKLIELETEALAARKQAESAKRAAVKEAIEDVVEKFNGQGVEKLSHDLEQEGDATGAYVDQG